MLRNRLFSVMLVGALGLAGCSAGGAAKFPTAEGALKLERVVLYRNGVGYFERRGALDGEILTIKVRKDQINDLLKSLTVVDKGTGRAVSISMPLDPQTWANAALATLRPGSGDLAQVLDALRGTEVTLRSSEGTVAGRIVMVEELLDSPEVQPRGSMMPPPVSRDHRVTVLDGNEMKVVKLSKVKSIELGDGDLAMQFNRTLDASAGEGMFQQVGVSIRLTGEHSHDLLVSYVVSAPMWKPTYRVVLPAEGKGKALLQAWAVVDNTSGEDWGQVNLGLTSGAPIAFRYDLHTPRDVERSDMTESGVRRQAIAMVGESSFEPLPAPAPPPPTDVAEAEAYDFSDRDGLAGNRTAAKNEAAKGRKSAPFRSRDEAKPSSSVAPMGGAFAAGDAQALEQQQKTIDVESLRRSTLAQARAATVSGQTRFDIDSKVTVPDGTSTMVAIINADVEGEETFLFRPGGAGLGYESNPYRVIRFKNSTPFVLESGPIAIFSGGSFVGEGISDPVGAGTSATNPIAV